MKLQTIKQDNSDCNCSFLFFCLLMYNYLSVFYIFNKFSKSFDCENANNLPQVH